MARNKEEQSFLSQGGTLAAAAVISRVIGLIYRIPLTGILGDAGNNLYGCAFDIYNIFLLVSSFSLPVAVSRLVSEYRAKGEGRNADRVLKCAFFFAVSVGTLSGCVVFFGARWITDVVFCTPLSRFAVWALAPTLLITALLGVFRGYFQGLERMRTSAVSQVFEQLVNAVVSVAAAYLLSRYAIQTDGTYRAAYGAAGASLGTTTGALAALLLLFLLYRKFRSGRAAAVPGKNIKNRNTNRNMNKKMNGEAPEEGYGRLFCAMLWTVLPVLAAAALYNINIVLEQAVFKHMLTGRADASDISRWWGVFSGKFKTLVNLPVAVAAAIGAACIPGITASSAGKDESGVREKTSLTLRYTMIIALPSAFCLMLLADPVMRLLFGDAGGLAQGLLLSGGVTVVFYSLSTVMASILQGCGRLSAPVVNSAVSLSTEMLVLYCLLKFTRLGIYSVILAMAVFGVLVTALNWAVLYRSGLVKQKRLHGGLLLAVCAGIMASVSRLVFFVLSRFIPALFITLPVSVLSGLYVYGALLTGFGVFSKRELGLLPGGAWLAKLYGFAINYKKSE